MKKKILLPLLITLSLCFLVTFFYFNKSISGQVPNIAVTTVSGKKIVLNQLQGKPTLISFWSTDCTGCIKEIPDLKALHQEFASQGLTVLAIAMSYDKIEHIHAMIKAKNLPYSIAYDASAEAAKAFGNVRLTPTNFLIRPDGSIAMQKVGAFDMLDTRKKIKLMLETS